MAIENDYILLNHQNPFLFFASDDLVSNFAEAIHVSSLKFLLPTLCIIRNMLPCITPLCCCLIMSYYTSPSPNSKTMLSLSLVLPISTFQMCVGCSVLSSSLRPNGLYPTRLLFPWNYPGKNTGMGSHSLLQRISPTQGSNPGLPHYRWILYQLSHQGRPKPFK